MPCQCDNKYDDNMAGGDVSFWGTEMNKEGFMGIVDKIWILLNRISTILLIIFIIVVIILIIIGWEPAKNIASSISSSTDTFRWRRSV